MNNAILFFFDISIPNIKKINNNYYFKYLNSNYGIYLYERNPADIVDIYNLNMIVLKSGIGYEIILTKNNEILFNYKNSYYILMKFPNVNNRLLNYNDIINFNFEIGSINNIDKSNWGSSWSNKIDFIEYQFNQMKSKYPIISNYIDYYIGLWENAISYFNNNIDFNNKKYICHKRVNIDMDLYDFLNPLNFVIDYKERDIGDYLKSYIINKNYSLSTFDNVFNRLSRNSIILIITRVLFPSYFFDLYESIIVDKKDEQEILEIIKKNKNIISFLKYIFNKFYDKNIPYIDWIIKSD